jgi:hypothetical protein
MHRTSEIVVVFGQPVFSLGQAMALPDREELLRLIGDIYDDLERASPQPVNDTLVCEAGSRQDGRAHSKRRRSRHPAGGGITQRGIGPLQMGGDRAAFPGRNYPSTEFDG